MRIRLSRAEDFLGQAARLCGAAHSSPSPVGRHLHAARVHLRLSHEILLSHTDADGAPRSPYLYLLGTPGAQSYVLLRVTELAWHTGSLSTLLADRADDAALVAALRGAQHAMHDAVILSRRRAPAAMWDFGELPAVPVLDRRDVQGPGSARALEGTAEDADRVVCGVYRAACGTGQPLSGSDIQQIARSFALGHLLTGRALLHLATEQPAPVRESLRRAAGDLRDAAKRWQQLAQAFNRVVDVTDPREHPQLPRYGYQDVRAGRANPMPRTQPHPAAIAAQAMTLRIGQLLYGTSWRPTAPAPQPRRYANIIAATGGLQHVVAALHRPLAAARFLADAGPRLLTRQKPHLVTDDPEGRPLGLAPGLRWYPLTARQLDVLSDACHAVTPAAAQAAEALAATARTIGAEPPRLRLDAAALRALRLDSPDRPAPSTALLRAADLARARQHREPQYRQPPTESDLSRALRTAYAQPRNRPAPPRTPRPPGI